MICLGCGARTRHQLNSAARLRERRCGKCGTTAMRTVQWVTANPERARELAALARLGIFETNGPRAY